MLDDGVVMVYPGEVSQQFGSFDGVDCIGIEMLRCCFDTGIFRVFETVVAGTCSDFGNPQTALLQQGYFGFFVENVVLFNSIAAVHSPLRFDFRYNYSKIK